MTHQTFLQNLAADDRARLTALTNRAGLIHLILHAGAIGLLALGVARGVPGWPALVPLLGLFLACLFHLLHEVSHQTVFATRALNTWVARVCGFVLLIPPIWFRAFHFAHHKHTHDPDHDPELATPKPRTRRAYLWHLTGVPLWHSLIKTLITNARGACRAAYVPPRQMAKVTAEARVMLALYVSLLLISLLAQSAQLFWIWVLPMLLGQPFLRAYLMAEHTDCPHVPDMFANTRTIFTNPVVRWLAWNMPYHAEHHAFPTVPFHQLPALHALARNELKATADGYSGFHADYAARLTP